LIKACVNEIDLGSHEKNEAENPTCCPRIINEELFGRVMGRELFVRVLDATDAPIPENDLFAGLR